MPLSPSYIDFAVELLAGFGPLEVKKMFGGASLARNGTGFAVLEDDTLFIKADPAFAAELKKQGSKPWRYSLAKDGAVRDIGFWSLPETALDDPDEAAQLARRAFEVSKAAAVAKALKKPAKPKSAARPKPASRPKPAARPKAAKTAKSQPAKAKAKK
jgi:DNA transformation protein and related proteins